MNSIIKTKVNSSYFYFLLGFVFLFFSNGRWILPVAAFTAPIFIIRFLRFHKPFIGFLILAVAGWVANIFAWQGIMPMSGFLYYLVTLMMSIFTSLTYLIDRIFARKLNGIVSTLIFPCAYVVMEYITISTNPSGSYGTLVHTQTSLAFLQLVSITGIWGVVFIILWLASMLNWLWDHAFEKTRLRQTVVVFVLPVMGILLFGQIRLSHGVETKTVRIASISMRRAYWESHSYGSRDSIAQKVNDDFLANCDIAASSQARIVFGTEGLITLPVGEATAFIEKAKATAVKDNIYLGLSMCLIPKTYPRDLLINRITWISPQGQELFTYFKSKPTPPSEGSYGDGVIRYFDSPYGRIGSAICFDMDFPSLISQVHGKDIDIMLVPGNDWRDITPYHTYVASLRGLEQGFNLVRAASQGLSASFDYTGQLLSSQNFYTSDDVILYHDVPMKGQRTVYSMVGDVFAWLCIAGFVVIIISTLFHRKADMTSINE